VGGTIWRKGIDILLRAWAEAFRTEDPVCLLVKGAGNDPSYAGQGIADLLDRVAQMPGVPSVHVLHDELSDDDMGRLYVSADVLVHPYRGEGFGLPVLEARACGLPVIVTGGGATDDFVDARAAVRLPASRIQVEIQETCVGQPWVLEPDRAALVAALRAAVGATSWREEARELAAEVHEGWSWNAVAARIEGEATAVRAADVVALRAASP
jgi:glycosyltransferase involved in cell wall biosynthesis